MRAVAPHAMTIIAQGPTATSSATTIGTVWQRVVVDFCFVVRIVFLFTSLTFFHARHAGFEPTTTRLTVGRSAIELVAKVGLRLYLTACQSKAFIHIPDEISVRYSSVPLTPSSRWIVPTVAGKAHRPFAFRHQYHYALTRY